MAKLNRIILAALRKSNKPENIKGIVNRGYAYDYANYLVGFGDKLPKDVANWIIEKGQPRTTLELVKKMDAQGMDVPDAFIKSICKDPVLAIKYASDAIDSDTPIPQTVINSINERAKLQSRTIRGDAGTMVGTFDVISKSILELVSKMEMRGLDVPEGFIEIIYRNPEASVLYALQKYDYDPEIELDSKIIQSIMNGERSIKTFVNEFLSRDLDVELFSLEQWTAMAEKMAPYIGISNTLYSLVRKLIENGIIKNYKQISRKIIESILKDSNVVNKFAHFLLPYVKELPEEIKSKVTNQNVLKPDWRKVKKFDENFSSFFKKK